MRENKPLERDGNSSTLTPTPTATRSIPWVVGTLICKAFSSDAETFAVAEFHVDSSERHRFKHCADSLKRSDCGGANAASEAEEISRRHLETWQLSVD